MHRNLRLFLGIGSSDHIQIGPRPDGRAHLLCRSYPMACELHIMWGGKDMRAMEQRCYRLQGRRHMGWLDTSFSKIRCLRFVVSNGARIFRLTAALTCQLVSSSAPPPAPPLPSPGNQRTVTIPEMTIIWSFLPPFLSHDEFTKMASNVCKAHEAHIEGCTDHKFAVPSSLGRICLFAYARKDGPTRKST